MEFEWDATKSESNARKHGLSFEEAQYAFIDPQRVIAIDHKHSTNVEKRYFCFGKAGGKVITVRFTLRGEKIRIFGAGCWREGNEKYNGKK
jgi:uncharacterized protein